MPCRQRLFRWLACRVASLGHAERQIPALIAKQRVLALLERGDTMKHQARGPAPDQHIAMGKRQAPGGTLARQPAPEKAASQAQRNRDYGRRKVMFVLVAAVIRDHRPLQGYTYTLGLLGLVLFVVLVFVVTVVRMGGNVGLRPL